MEWHVTCVECVAPPSLQELVALNVTFFVAFQGYQLGRNHMRIGYGRGTPTTLLWVGGLGYWVSKAELEQEFDRFGMIRWIDYRPDESYSYIQYDSLDAAIAACNEMRGSRLGGHKLQVDFADPHLTHSQSRDRKVTYTPPFVSFRTSQGYKAAPRRYDQQRGNLDHHSEPRTTGHRQQLDQYEDINDFELPPYEPIRRDSRNSYGDDVRYDSEPVTRRRPTVEYERYQNVGHQNATRPNAARMGFHSRHADNGQPPSKRPRLNSETRPVTRPHQPRPVPRPSLQQRIENAKSARRTSSISQAVRRFSTSGHQRTRHASVHEQLQHKSKDNSLRPVSRSRAYSDSKSYSKPRVKTKGSLLTRSQSARDSKPDKTERKEKEAKPEDKKSSKTTTVTTTKTAESLSDLAKRFAVAWKGQLQLKTAAFTVRMHLIAGDPSLADQLLRGARGQTIANTSFSVTQRLRLEQTKLEEVS